MVGQMLTHVRTELEAEVDSILVRAADGEAGGWQFVEDGFCVFPGQASAFVFLSHDGYELVVNLDMGGRVAVTRVVERSDGSEGHVIVGEMRLRQGAMDLLEDALYPEHKLVPLTEEQAAAIAAIKIAEDA